MIKEHYDAVFISPHIDDVVFSCGGILAQYCREGRCLVLSIFSDTGRSTAARKEEERTAAYRIGFNFDFLDLPDNSRRELLGFLPCWRYRTLAERRDGRWIKEMCSRVRMFLNSIEAHRIFFPLGVGRHIDHQICFELAFLLEGFREILFYEDIPYTLKPKCLTQRLCEVQINKQRALRPVQIPLDDFFELKMNVIWTYSSQAPLFFKNYEHSYALLKAYHSREREEGFMEQVWRLES